MKEAEDCDEREVVERAESSLISCMQGKNSPADAADGEDLMGGWIGCGEQNKGLASGERTRRHVGQIWPSCQVLQIKFYWNTMFICLQMVSGCFHAAAAELSSCRREHRTHKAKDIYYLALFTKQLTNPSLDHRVHTLLSHSNATDLSLSIAKPDSTPHLFSVCTNLKLWKIRLGKVKVCDISLRKIAGTAKRREV